VAAKAFREHPRVPYVCAKCKRAPRVFTIVEPSSDHDLISPLSVNHLRQITYDEVSTGGLNSVELVRGPHFHALKRAEVTTLHHLGKCSFKSNRVKYGVEPDTVASTGSRCNAQQ
jgi:hypothetical protein